MGANAARAAVIRNPRLLKGRASTLREALPALQAMLGKEKAEELVMRNPEVLKGRVATLREALPALQQVLQHALDSRTAHMHDRMSTQPYGAHA
jgi:hypothetical protein